ASAISSMLEEDGLLQTHIKEVILLQHYIESDQSLSQPVIDKPTSITGKFPEINLHVVLSQETDPGIRLKADKESYARVVQELEDYQQKLIQQKELLVDQKASDCLPPDA